MSIEGVKGVGKKTVRVLFKKTSARRDAAICSLIDPSHVRLYKCTYRLLSSVYSGRSTLVAEVMLPQAESAQMLAWNCYRLRGTELNDPAQIQLGSALLETVPSGGHRRVGLHPFSNIVLPPSVCVLRFAPDAQLPSRMCKGLQEHESRRECLPASSKQTPHGR